MRTKRATRYNAESEHNSYGIFNYFRLKGITNQETINEVIYAFCDSNGFEGLNPNTPEKTKLNFVSNRFQKFAQFAMNYLRENNYL